MRRANAEGHTGHGTPISALVRFDVLTRSFTPYGPYARVHVHDVRAVGRAPPPTPRTTPLYVSRGPTTQQRPRQAERRDQGDSTTPIQTTDPRHTHADTGQYIHAPLPQHARKPYGLARPRPHSRARASHNRRAFEPREPNLSLRCARRPSVPSRSLYSLDATEVEPSPPTDPQRSFPRRSSPCRLEQSMRPHT